MRPMANVANALTGDPAAMARSMMGMTGTSETYSLFHCPQCGSLARWVGAPPFKCTDCRCVVDPTDRRMRRPGRLLLSALTYGPPSSPPRLDPVGYKSWSPESDVTVEARRVPIPDVSLDGLFWVGIQLTMCGMGGVGGWLLGDFIWGLF